MPDDGAARGAQHEAELARPGVQAEHAGAANVLRGGSYNADGSRMSTPRAESHDHSEQLVTANSVKA